MADFPQAPVARRVLSAGSVAFLGAVALAIVREEVMFVLCLCCLSRYGEYKGVSCSCGTMYTTRAACCCSVRRARCSQGSSPIIVFLLFLFLRCVLQGRRGRSCAARVVMYGCAQYGRIPTFLIMLLGCVCCETGVMFCGNRHGAPSAQTNRCFPAVARAA